MLKSSWVFLFSKHASCLIRVCFNLIMKKKLYLVLLISILTGCWGEKRSAILDTDGKYHVSWTVDDKTSSITFEVTVKTIGYVGFGISPTGGMIGADIVIGGVSPNGSFYFQDRYAEVNGIPVIDRHQDWTLLESSENDTYTYLKFSRQITTCDSQDVTITNGAQRFIWAIGQNDNVRYHEADRGALAVNILDPPPKQIDLTKYKSFDAIMNVTMPPRVTSYWCTVHQSPVFTTKQHIIAYGPKMLTLTARRHSHHLTFYECQAPEGEDPDNFFEPFIIPGGQDCLNGSMTERALEIYMYCTVPIYSWAIGGRVMHMPEEVGYPLSDGEGRKYFLLEMHLNNPESLPNIELSTGVEIHYTAALRQMEAGFISMGAALDWRLAIPPNSKDFKIAAHCTSACTQFLDEEGITLFNVKLHGHSTANKMRLRHFRDRTELPWIADDQTYDNGFQDNRNIRPVKMLPGDHLTLECGFDNSRRNPPVTVIGGYSTSDEMCGSAIYYYPVDKLAACGSENLSSRLMKLLRISKLLAKRNRRNPEIVYPRELKGMKILEYMNTRVNWTNALRQAVQKELTIGPHFTLCGMYDVTNDELYDAIYRYPPSATYPKIEREYQPINECLVKAMKEFEMRRDQVNDEYYNEIP